ncbi:MAG: hypothetical protein MUE79_06520 [Nitratireductor sp.]|nr:hypothetical protein [Nitratireductor sp.]
MRIMHEAALYDRNCFVTWTYADEFLPTDLSVSVDEMQRLFKRLRLEVGPCRNVTCGEYGDRNLRPHYHSILFGHDFYEERYPWKRTEGGVLYRVPTLEKVWQRGHVLVGDVTLQSAGYVAGYVRKKLNGQRGEAALQRCAVDPSTGEVREWKVAREFLIMSRKPGIGAGWFERFACDAFPSDFLIVDGKRVSVPRYYLNKLAEVERASVVQRRRERAMVHADNNRDSRLLVRHEVATLKAARLVRSLDAET